MPWTEKWLLLFNMSKTEEVVRAHPEGEARSAGGEPPETVASLDTFAGKIHVKWAPEATVSSLGLMPFFIEFLKTSGLFEKWVEDCPLRYTSGRAAQEKNKELDSPPPRCGVGALGPPQTQPEGGDNPELLGKGGGAREG